MDISLNLQVGIALWLGVIALLIIVQLRTHTSGVGLVVAYILGLALIHVPAAVLYVLPGYFYNDPAVVQAGFEQSVFAVIGLVIGALVVAPLLARNRRSPLDALSPPEKGAPSYRLPVIYLLIGLASYLVVTPLIGSTPTLTALVSVANQFVLVGICLGGWHAWQQGSRARFAGFLALALCLPVLTTLLQGFLGFGALATMTALVFAGSYFRPRWVVLLLGVVVAYVGLSVFVTYFRDRDAIRAAVWGGLPIEQRVEQLQLTLSSFEWFDLTNSQHLQFVDGRLNQNQLVGAAVQYLQGGYVGYGYGETLFQAGLALVPRALWPDKPVFAGSPGLVSRFTGVQYAVGTSVGVGQVMEFYINFGTWGVVVGFIVFGAALRYVDTAAAELLRADDWQRFSIWFLIGLAFLQSGGSLVEVVGTIGASVVTGYLVNRYLVPVRAPAASQHPAVPTLTGSKL